MPVFALNLFNLAPNDDYREYSRSPAQAVEKPVGVWWPSATSLRQSTHPEPNRGRS